METTFQQVPFWNLFERTKRLGFPEEELLSVYREYGVIRKDDREDNHNRPGNDLAAYQLVEQGDLVLNKMKTWQGSLGVSPFRGIVSPAYFVYRALTSNDSQFLHYALRSPRYIKYYAANSKGVRPGQWDLQPEQLDVMKVALPPLDTQRAIANYLDRETSEIDAMLDKLDGLGRLLEERLELAIRAAVSDMERKYPRAAIQTLGLIHSGDVIPAVMIKDNGEYPVYGGNGLRGHTDSYNQSSDKLLIGRQGALCGNVHLATGKYWASEHALVVTPNIEFNAKWLLYVLRNEKLGQLSTAAAQPGITASAVGRQKVPLPPLDEQERIVAHLDETTARIDAMITKTRQLKDLLVERRSALITAAVTGQIEVH